MAKVIETEIGTALDVPLGTKGNLIFIFFTLNKTNSD